MLSKRNALIICFALVYGCLWSFAVYAEFSLESFPRQGGVEENGSRPSLQCRPCEAFHELNTQIRDGRIAKTEAVGRFRSVVADIDAYADRIGLTRAASTGCVFPLRGYSAAAIGGSKGSGYMQNGYDYFDGNAHMGHPAHDLFIRDRNQDILDDATGKPVWVLAMVGGLVVSVENEWEHKSRLRGGRYVWIYNPRDASLTYYAHNETILVRIGDWVKPGDPIATVGRTGYNAFRKKSPTHLHLMHLLIRDGRPKPENRYNKISSTCEIH